MQDDITGWSEWESNFSKIEEITSPSELHGLLTGIVCVTETPNQEEWLKILSTLNVPTLSPTQLALLTEEAEDVAHVAGDE